MKNTISVLLREWISGKTLATGIRAGIIGAVTDDVFLLIAGAASWPATYQWIASGLVGKVAYSSMGYAALGILMHVLISIAWGLLFSVVSRPLPLLRRRPVWSGIFYGLFVFALMQLVTAAAHLWSAPSGSILAILIISHTLFFGLPIALYVSRD